MFNNSQSIEIEDFIQLYPKIETKTETINIHKYLSYFNDSKKFNNSNGFTFKEKNVVRHQERCLSNKLKEVKEEDIENIEKKKRRKTYIEQNKLMIINTFDDNKLDDIKENILFDSNDVKKNKKKNEEEEKQNNYYIIKKAVYLQKNKLDRTEDIKKSIKAFLYDSQYFEKLEKNLQIFEIKNLNKKLSYKEENEFETTIKTKITNKINNIILKLSEKLEIKYYYKNDFIVKKGDKGGEDCFFVLSGKVSILKPVEYSGIKISFKHYFIYLKALLNANEINLILNIISLNTNYLNISTIEELSKIIKGHFVMSLKRELNKKPHGITLQEIESFFDEYHFTLEDLQLNRKKISEGIEKMTNKSSNNPDEDLRQFFYEIVSNYNEEIILANKYNVFGLEKQYKASEVTLYKYDIFLNLYPGNFFADISLDNKTKKINANVRAEEDCILGCLSQENYNSILVEENKKMKALNLGFLYNNFFFNKMSPSIFNNSYYHLFREFELDKGDVIFNQNDEPYSVFFLKEGEVKMELKGTIHDIYKLIKLSFNDIFSKFKNFNIKFEQIDQLKRNYLSDDNLKEVKNKYLLSEMNKKTIFDICSSNGYECLGIQEFFFKKRYITSCTVASKKVVLLELRKEYLTKIIREEAEITGNFNNLVLIKLISFIKRLHHLKNNFIYKNKNILEDNILQKNNSDYYKDEKFNNDHKMRVEILNSRGVKKIYYDAKKISENNNDISNHNRFSLTNRNINRSMLSTKKNISLYKKFSLPQTFRHSSNVVSQYSCNNKNKNKNEIISNYNNNLIQKNANSKNTSIKNISTLHSKNNYKNKNANNKNNTIKNSNNSSPEKNKNDKEIVKVKNRLICLNDFRKLFIRRNESLDNLNIVKKVILPYDEEKLFKEGELSHKSIKISYKGYSNINFFKYGKACLIKKYFGESFFNMSKEENENNKNNISAVDLTKKNSKSTSDVLKKNKEIENFCHKKCCSKTSFQSFSSFNKTNKRIQKLILEMKKRYALCSGEKKYIYIRSSKKNRVFYSVDEKVNNNSSIKTKRESIKEYYLKKKIEGYSSIINPLNNTYINRQITYKNDNIYPNF